MTHCILITIDCLRFDHLGCYGYDKPTTPNIDNLAKDGIIFTNAFSNGSYTTASFASLFTSSHQLRYWGEDLPLPSQKPTLAEVMNNMGFHTAAFHSNPYLSSKHGYSRGFDYFEDFGVKTVEKEERIQGLRGRTHGVMASIYNKFLTLFDKNEKNESWLYKLWQLISFYIVSNVGYSGARAKGSIITDKLISRLNREANSFFWVHYMDVHGPYIPPNKYREKFSSKKISKLNQATALYKREWPSSITDEEIYTLTSLYDGGIAYVDENISKLITQLKKMDMYDDTLLIITSDHGEEFNEHNDFEHKPKLYDELIHIPLIIKLPKGSYSKKVEGLCSLVDIAPTILDNLKMTQNIHFEGQSLIPMIEGKSEGKSCIISAGGLYDSKTGDKNKKISLRTQKWKYIFNEKEENELYDLENDPKEQSNVINVNVDVSKKLESKLNELTKKIYYEEDISVEKDEILIKRLKALGYL